MLPNLGDLRRSDCVCAAAESIELDPGYGEAYPFLDLVGWEERGDS